MNTPNSLGSNASSASRTLGPENSVIPGNGLVATPPVKIFTILQPGLEKIFIPVIC